MYKHLRYACPAGHKLVPGAEDVRCLGGGACGQFLCLHETRRTSKLAKRKGEFKGSETAADPDKERVVIATGVCKQMPAQATLLTMKSGSRGTAIHTNAFESIPTSQQRIRSY